MWCRSDGDMAIFVFFSFLKSNRFVCAFPGIACFDKSFFAIFHIVAEGWCFFFLLLTFFLDFVFSSFFFLLFFSSFFLTKQKTENRKQKVESGSKIR